MREERFLPLLSAEIECTNCKFFTNRVSFIDFVLRVEIMIETMSKANLFIVPIVRRARPRHVRLESQLEYWISIESSNNKNNNNKKNRLNFSGIISR